MRRTLQVSSADRQAAGPLLRFWDAPIMYALARICTSMAAKHLVDNPDPSLKSLGRLVAEENLAAGPQIAFSAPLTHSSSAVDGHLGRVERLLLDC